MDTALLCVMAAGLVTGFSKFSVGGMGLLILPLLMIAYPGPQALAMLLPMYLVTDLMALISYRKSIDWVVVRRVLPLSLVGVILGGWVLSGINAEQFTTLLAVMIIAMLILGFVLDRFDTRFMKHPIAAYVAGILGGTVSLTSNAAGPIFSLYLMEQKLSKEAYVSTRAWVFALINISKVPMLWSLGLLTMESTLISLQGIPGLVVGAMIGYYFLKRLDLNQFKWLIRGMAALAALKLLVLG
ncbi:sulfite exporter TauE/SafE family protein [Leucothrix sargassi]|nr:sulfite exporter TauE/SafE family protein [Leucothrix sargassi]